METRPDGREEVGESDCLCVGKIKCDVDGVVMKREGREYFYLL